ncbi:2-hydroxyacid dehydrogenase [Ponticoccus alexandrii]|uniref:Glyoxylate/hydroxypyruvate reductase A n=1 Tax=Ponticoccus alexandrii TaxID=1943633 RepID=A0ABX7FFI5_9RHOB|nr:glyoxylate/hydroxypyruvate reductase A [Ponticoccus alexandrii]ETA49383.1 3-phosphoglycerate dehydrogenase [Rhodobacteraceae bacterium PD-2]QRF69291.1 glyoxylate/hydroxypyruvate reductase A [Ponticoccus alexandrii]
MALLFTSTPDRQPVWQALFDAEGIPMIAGEDAVTDPKAVTAIACWVPPADLSRYPNLRAVISVGAGVDHLPPLPEGVVLSRTLAPGIEAMVRDWVVMATLMLHRDMPRYLEQGRTGSWQSHPVALASSRRVGILGMGRIGTLAAVGLQRLGFDVAGLSRSGRQGVVPMFAASGMKGFLARSDLLICLLPLTPETRGILSAETLSALPRGACLVHAGRGAHLDTDALREALDTGRISAAMLDVTNPEPLPADHWMWQDPRVIVTPHVAAQTDATEGAHHALAVMRSLRDGTPVPGLVDQARGY